MKKYHFTCRFIGSDYSFHGSFETAFTGKDMLLTLTRNAVSKLLSYWEKKSEDMVSIEIYEYINGDENIIFKWEKQ